MRYINVILFSFFLVLNLVNQGYCSKLETIEIECNEKYKFIYKYAMESTDEINLLNDGLSSLEYGVYIFKNHPNSIAAYLNVFILKNVIDKCTLKNLVTYYERYEDAHMINFDDPNYKLDEKIIFLILYANGAKCSSRDELQERHLKVINILNSMKESCIDKNYAALANIMLFNVTDKDKRVEQIKNFIDKFPDHKAIQFVKLKFINHAYNDDPNKCIEEIIKLSSTYGNQLMPNGWKFYYDCYYDIVRCYVVLKDYQNAIKYYKMMEIEAPYSSNLIKMKDYIEKTKNN